MSFWSNLFNTYRVIRFNFITVDNKHFSAKISIKIPNGSSEEKVKDALKNILYVEKGINIKYIKILGFYETNSF